MKRSFVAFVIFLYTLYMLSYSEEELYNNPWQFCNSLLDNNLDWDIIYTHVTLFTGALNLNNTITLQRLVASISKSGYVVIDIASATLSDLESSDDEFLAF